MTGTRTAVDAPDAPAAVGPHSHAIRVVGLHGYPQSHLMWHAAAPLLTDRHTVVAPDLAGYGASFRPAPTPDHAPHGKRAMAVDQVEAMAALGFESFASPATT